MVDAKPPDPALVEKLRTYDGPRTYLSKIEAPGTLTLLVDPPTTQMRLEEYRQREGQLVPEPLDEPRTGATYKRTLPSGSYRLVLTAPGRHTVRYPFLLKHGEPLELRLRLPAEESVPKGFIYVPAGRYLTGITGDEAFRRRITATPAHVTYTGGFLVARNEATFSEWLQLIERLPLERQRRLMPSGYAEPGRLSLDRTTGRWRIHFKPSAIEFVVKFGEKLIYPERVINRAQDWSRFPVSSISPRQARAYAALQSGLLNPRLCSESEWERAARGADGRSFTVGEKLYPSQANFDVSYRRGGGAFGPDEIGSHPDSASPFGAEDMEGNAFEIVESSHDDTEIIEKGGSWYHSIDLDGHLAGRYGLEAETRTVTLGFRLCADLGEK
jgi:formylglycine-generating enzyme required for sulfatase activity